MERIIEDGYWVIVASDLESASTEYTIVLASKDYPTLSLSPTDIKNKITGKPETGEVAFLDKVAVVFIDPRYPDNTSLEKSVHTLMEKYRTIPIPPEILTTSDNMYVPPDGKKKTPSESHIKKPVQLPELFEKISSAIEMYKTKMKSQL